jgi:surface antigen
MRYGNLGNALDWSRNWQARGGVLAGSASVGAVANFQPGVDGARPLGHVAVVVRAGNPFVISEMNGPRGPGETDLRSCGNGPGVTFLVESSPPLEDDLTPAQDAKLTAIFNALFEPVALDGGQGFPSYANPNNVDIIRRVVSPYAKGYPPANPPKTP